jgi:hypothetical protein
VKSPFSLPLFLLAFLVLFLAGFSGIALMAAWIGRAGDSPVEAAREVLASGAAYVRLCLPAALLPATFLTALRAARHPVSRPFTLILPVATVFALLYFAPMGLRLFEPSAPAADSRPSPGAYLRPGVLTEVGGPGVRGRILVAARASEGGSLLEDLVVLSPQPPESRLSYAPRGALALGPSGAAVRLEGAGTAVSELDVGSATVWEQMVEPSEATSALIADLRYLDGELDAASAASELRSVLLCVSLAALLCFSTVLLRMTRWPLFGFVLLCLLWRGALVAIRFVGETVRPGLAQLLPGTAVGSFVADNSIALLLAAAGALFLVVDLLFVSFDFWKREIEA